MPTSLPIQSTFDKDIPDNFGNAEYRTERLLLITINDIIVQGKLDQPIIKYFLDVAYANKAIRVWGTGKSAKLTASQRDNVRSHAVMALRLAMLRKHLNLSLRKFALALSHSDLYKWFCSINRFALPQVPGKSTIAQLENSLPMELIEQVEKRLFAVLQNDSLQMPEPLEFSKCYFDCTCICANIHHPVDWLLLRDATRTLMKATARIRKLGLLNRMPCKPSVFISKMNKLCMQMTFAKRKKGSKQLRKSILRQMKKLIKRVSSHAINHLKLLESHWQAVNISRCQANQILKQITNVTDKLATATKNAHERIIGQRKVANKDKILSLYEDDVNVVVRKKTNAEVEFGNTLYLAEQENGLIVDWKFYRQSAPSDNKMLKQSHQRIEENVSVKVKLLAGDRGFDSETNRNYMASNDIFNAVCPRNPALLAERLKEDKFRQGQKRRSQTEARIAILSNCFCSSPMKQKGFAHRHCHLALSILSHNIWVLARVKIAQQQALQAA